MNTVLIDILFISIIFSIATRISRPIFTSGFTFVTVRPAGHGSFTIQNRDHLYRSSKDDEINDSSGTVRNIDDDDGLIKIISGAFRSTQIQEYWGKRPLLVRDAFPLQQHRHAWPSWDDIVQLSCDDDLPSAALSLSRGGNDDNCDSPLESGESARFIQYVPGTLDTFTLDVGPFDRNELQRRMSVSATTSKSRKNQKRQRKAWSLLLNDVERYCPELDAWMNEHFHFLPRWRRDDAQISCTSTIDGSIGPHVDNYDVCLIQISGKRSWRILLASPLEDTLSYHQEQQLLIPNIPVSVLNLTATTTPNTDHNPANKATTHITALELEQSQWVELLLHEGDLLYLPPRFVHWGLGQSTDCMTLSVGARAPSASDLLICVTEHVQQSRQPLSSLSRYIDDPNTMTFLRNDRTSTISDSQNDNRRIEPDSTDQQQSLSKAVKESMKILVRDMMDDVLNDDSMWDMIVGKLITDPLRYSDTFPVPLAEYPPTQNRDNFWDTLSSSPRDLLQRIQQLGPHASLRKVAGVSSARSQVQLPSTSSENHSNNNHSATIIDRLYIHGEMYEVDSIRNISESHDPTLASIIFHRIDDSLPIYGTLLRNVNRTTTDAKLLQVLHDLIEIGILRPRYESNQ